MSIKEDTQDIKFWYDTEDVEYILEDGTREKIPQAYLYHIEGEIPHWHINQIRIFATIEEGRELLKLYHKATETDKIGDWLRLLAYYCDLKEKSTKDSFTRVTDMGEFDYK
jgi:hypothetical protein